MTKNKMYFLLPTLLAMLVLAASILTIASAAITVNVLDNQVSVTDTENSNTVENGTVTIKASGSLFRKTTNTITIKNETSNTAKLTFSYSATTYNSFTIAGASASASGTYSTLLDSQSSVSVVLVSNSGFSNTTATLTLSNFSLVAAATSSQVTIEYDNSLGSVTAGGTTVTSGTTQEVSLTDGVALVATANDSTFLGWVDASDGSLLSTAASYTFTPATDTTVKAAFAKDGETPWFGVGGALAQSFEYGLLNLSTLTYYTMGSPTYLFDDFNDAMEKAASSSTYKYVVLMNNGTLPAGSYTIPAGVTLLIPFDSANTLYKEEPVCVGSFTKPTAYRTLTLAEGASITINGALSLSAKNRYAVADAANGGSPTGACSFIKMDEGSSIVINDGGNLYAWGYIMGSGTVTAKSGATVYENLQFSDCRGGTQTTGMDNGVFPFSQYYVQNIEVPLIMESGALEVCSMSIYMSKMTFITNLDFIGGSGMFRLNSGKFTKDYIENEDRLHMTLEGDMTVSSIKLTINGVTINSADYVFPINNNITVEAVSGSFVIAEEQSLSVLPGGEIIIHEGVAATVNSSVYLYDVDEWGTYCSSTNKKFKPLGYAPGRTYTRTEADLVDARIQIDGIAIVNGALYTTAGGANICSSGTGTLTLKAKGEETVTYQLVQGSSEGTGYKEIPITSAVLKHGDGTYTAATVANTYTYENGRWVCAAHSYVYGEPVDATCATGGYTPGECSVCGATIQKDVTTKLEHNYQAAVTKPTCTEQGYTTYTCQNGCGDSYTGDVVSALSHTWVNGTEVSPTCTTDGYTSQSCSVCGATNTTNIKEQLGHDYKSVVTAPTCTAQGYTTHSCKRDGCDDSYVDAYVDANGHSYNAGVVTEAPTCTATGVKTFTCGTCGGTKTETVAAKGHTNATIEAVAPTCTATGLTAGVKCSVCNAVLTAQQEVPAVGHAWNDGEVTTDPTCTVEGVKTFTCDTCGATETEVVAATGHSYTSSVTAPTCTVDGYTTYTCSCGDSYTSDTVAATGHSYASVVTAPTCTAAGYTTYTCSCGDSYTSDTVAAMGHSYTFVVTAPTCTAQGYTTHTCSSCGNSKVDTYVDATGHNYDTVITAPTCTEKGYKTYTCTSGDHTYVADYKDANGHTYGEPSYDWTGTKLTVTLTCSMCDSDTTGHTLPGSADGTEISHTDGDCQTKSTKTYTATVSLNGTNYTKKTTIEGDFGDHTWNDGDETIAPTCKDEGVKTLTCTIDGCEETKTESIPKTNDHTDENPDDGICDVCKNTICVHEWGTPEYNWSEDGKICTATRVCSNDANHIQQVTATKITSEVTISSTCIEMGTTTYTATFEDWANTANISTKDVKNIPKVDHTWDDGAITTEPGCESMGVKTFTCTVDGCNGSRTEEVGATGHSYTTTVTAPTCEAQGYTTHTCSNCTDTYDDNYVDPIGHKWNNGEETTPPTCTEEGVKTYTCQNDSTHTYTESVTELGHDYDSIVTAPTCTEQGYTTHSCKRDGCDYSYVDAYVDANGHSYNAGVVTKDPTCTATGVKTFTCGTCGGTKTETIVAKEHTPVIDAAVAPGCESTGLTEGSHCDVCSATIAAQTVVSALGHSYDAGVETTAPTCTTDGVKTYTCETCGGTKTKAVSSTGHNYTSVVTSPTCEADGYTTYTCSACGNSYTADEVDATGHKWNTGVVTTAPTCTEKGVKTFTCENDPSHTRTEEIAATGHNYETVVTDPTCEAAGYTTYTCTNTGCTYSYKSDEVAKLNHTWDEGVVTTASTCTEKGVKSFTCGTCGATQTTELDYAQHAYDDGVVTPATCESGGYTTYTCTNCTDSYIGKEVGALGHQYGEGTVTEPTCTKQGYTTYTCTWEGCNGTKKEKYVDALGHEEVVDAAVAATCTATGLTEGKHCSVCNTVLTAQEVVEMLGHSYEFVVTSPTCTEHGYTTYTCSTCGSRDIDDHTDPLGHDDTDGDNLCDHAGCDATVCTAEHDWEFDGFEWSIDETTGNATCTATRTCQTGGHSEKLAASGEKVTVEATCTQDGGTGYVAFFAESSFVGQYADLTQIKVIEEYPAGHVLIQVGAKAPTCTEVGYEAYEYCSNCTHTTYSEIPALGHQEETIAGKDATCTATGLTEGKKCTVCGTNTVAQQVIPMTSHDYNGVVTKDPTCYASGVKTFTCASCGDSYTEPVSATGNHNYVLQCDKEYKWKKCSNDGCEDIKEKAPRTFRIVFQGGTGGDDIVLPGVYFYGYNETFVVPEFTSNFFDYEYNWEVDGQKLEPGSIMDVSVLAPLIKTDPTESEWNTIYVPGGYRVGGLDPNAIQMSMQYENNTGAAGDIFLTLSIFVRVEPGMEHKVEQLNATEANKLSIKCTQVGNLGLYHYQIPLTAEQMNDENLKIKISYTENGNSVWFKEIGVNLTTYSAALNAMLGEGVTGDAAQILVNATMAYGAALQVMNTEDLGILNNFNPEWKTDAANVSVDSTIATAPEYSGEADCLTDAQGNLIPIAKITGANVAMSKTYVLLYSFEVNLPEGAERTDFRLILTDDEQALDRTKPWDGKAGTSYTKTSKVTAPAEDGSTKEYDVFAIEDVPASEMAVRYATIYVKYTTVGENGETVEHHAYSRTVKYGVVTYLNGQIAEMIKNGTPTAESDLTKLYLWNNLRTVAKYAEKDKD